MNYKVGHFRQYRSNQEIRLGGVDNYIMAVGEEFEFDGKILRLQDGREYDMPQLRAAIKKGWFSLLGEGSTSSSGGGESPRILVSDTEGGSRVKSAMRIETEDEYTAGNVEDRRVAREQAQRGLQNAPRAQVQSPLVREISSALKERQVAWMEDNGVRLPFDQREQAPEGFAPQVERPDYRDIEVARARPHGERAVADSLRQSTFNSKVQVFNEESHVGQIVTSSESSRGQTGVTAEVSAGPVGNVQIDTIAEVGAGGGKIARKVVADTGSSEGVIVGRVLSPATTSFEATDANTNSTAIRRTEEGKELKIAKVSSANRSGDNLSDIMPEAAVSPVPEAAPSSVEQDDEKLQVIHVFLPDFKWDKNRPTKIRVQDALKRKENKMWIKAILLYETPFCADAIRAALDL